jgi:hypothetical protein|tara:strand:- start:120 stop:227 length:108 start_codon:yes stop_codon:yes gene_type:complete
LKYAIEKGRKKKEKQKQSKPFRANVEREWCACAFG